VFASLEQRTAQLLLNAPDLFGEGWLTEVQKPCRPTKMQLLRKEHKGTKVSHFHNHMLSPK
jgi:hypothetical protein